jgi:hypothetical protein
VRGFAFALFAGGWVRLVEFFFEDIAANIDAFVADINAGAGDEFFYLGVALSAEGAHGEIGCAGHGVKTLSFKC